MYLVFDTPDTLIEGFCVRICFTPHPPRTVQIVYDRVVHFVVFVFSCFTWCCTFCGFRVLHGVVHFVDLQLCSCCTFCVFVTFLFCLFVCFVDFANLLDSNHGTGLGRVGSVVRTEPRPGRNPLGCSHTPISTRFTGILRFTVPFCNCIVSTSLPWCPRYKWGWGLWEGQLALLHTLPGRSHWVDTRRHPCVSPTHTAQHVVRSM